MQKKPKKTYFSDYFGCLSHFSLSSETQILEYILEILINLAAHFQHKLQQIYDINGQKLIFRLQILFIFLENHLKSSFNFFSILQNISLLL